MDGLDMSFIIYLTVDSQKSLDLFEIHLIVSRYVLVYQRSCRGSSSSPSSTPLLKFVLLHLRRSEYLIDDQSLPLASPCLGKYDPSLWSEIHQSDCYVAQYRFGTTYDLVPTTSIVYSDQIDDWFLQSLLAYSLLIVVLLSYLFNFILILIFLKQLTLVQTGTARFNSINWIPLESCLILAMSLLLHMWHCYIAIFKSSIQLQHSDISLNLDDYQIDIIGRMKILLPIS
jgi:hypothetical protein